MAVPDVSPMVGERRLTCTSHAVISAHSRCLVDVSLPDQARAVEPEPLQPPVEVEARRDGADEQEPRVGCDARTRANASSSCGTRLVALTLPNVPNSGLPATSRRRRGGHRERGMGDDPDRPGVPGGARTVAYVARVDDEAGREIEHLAGEMEVLRPASPRAAGCACRARHGRAAAPTTPPSRSIASR